MNNTITMPITCDNISFGELVPTPGIIFEGKFKNSSGFPTLPKNTFVRYGKRNNENFIIIERYSMFAQVVSEIKKKHPDYDIICSIQKGNRQTQGKVIAWLAPNTDTVWNLGYVIIKLSHEI